MNKVYLCNKCCSISRENNDMFDLIYYIDITTYIECDNCTISNIKNKCILIDKKQSDIIRLLYEK